MHEHLDSILDFAELQPYRTEPVKTLSSGMTARLGFAIATEFRPDILILDEVSAVGDEAFKRKCSERINTLWDEHATIIVVSHDLDFVLNNCDRAVWLEKGAVMCDGSPAEAVLRYRLSVEAQRLANGFGDPAIILLRAQYADSKYDNRIYAYVEGSKRWVPDERWLAERGLDPNEALRFQDDELDLIPDGLPMQQFDFAAS